MPYRSPATTGDGSGLPRESWSRRIRRWVLYIVVAVAAIAGWSWYQGRQRRAVQHLPVDERQALYQRTLENMKLCQTQWERGLKGICEEQAELLQAFPECDEECRRLAQPPPASLR